MFFRSWSASPAPFFHCPKSLLYRSQSIDLLYNSMDWFLYDIDIHHKQVQRDADAMNYFRTLVFHHKKYLFACCVKIKPYDDWNNFLYLPLSTGEINVKSICSLKICLDIANTCFPFENIFLTMNRRALRERRIIWYCQISISLFSRNLHSDLHLGFLRVTHSLLFIQSQYISL